MHVYYSHVYHLLLFRLFLSVVPRRILRGGFTTVSISQPSHFIHSGIRLRENSVTDKTRSRYTCNVHHTTRRYTNIPRYVFLHIPHRLFVRVINSKTFVLKFFCLTFHLETMVFNSLRLPNTSQIKERRKYY